MRTAGYDHDAMHAGGLRSRTADFSAHLARRRDRKTVRISTDPVMAPKLDDQRAWTNADLAEAAVASKIPTSAQRTPARPRSDCATKVT
jgi:hypothetical protein